MNHLQDIIDTTLRLCDSLERAANEDKKFCIDIQLALEKLSWEMLRNANYLKEIQDYSQG